MKMQKCTDGSFQPFLSVVQTSKNKLYDKIKQWFEVTFYVWWDIFVFQIHYPLFDPLLRTYDRKIGIHRQKLIKFLIKKNK